MCGDPPTIAFSSGPREGGLKDTVRNVEANGEFVVNVVDDAHAEAMNASSGEYPPEVDEFTVAGHMYSHTRDLFEMKRPNPNYKG